MIILVWGIIISISLYGYINLNHKATHLKERQENYVIQMQAESDYIASKEAKLLASLQKTSYRTRVLILVFLSLCKENH